MSAEKKALVASLMAADPEPYSSECVAEEKYYGVIADALLADGWTRVTSPGVT